MKCESASRAAPQQVKARDAMCRVVACLAPLFPMLIAIACDKMPATANAKATIIGPSPRELAATLIELRNQRAYTSMEELVLPQRARHLTSTLIAIDGFLVAEAELRDYVRDRAGFNVADAIDLSYFENGLGIFSRRVELLDETIDGERAEVQFIVDGAIPALAADFVVAQRQWRYDPGEGFEAELPRAFHEMTAGVRKFLSDLKSGHIPEDRLRDPEMLVREYSLRISPGLKLLPQPSETSPPSPGSV